MRRDWVLTGSTDTRAARVHARDAATAPNAVAVTYPTGGDTSKTCRKKFIAFDLADSGSISACVHVVVNNQKSNKTYLQVLHPDLTFLRPVCRRLPAVILELDGIFHLSRRAPPIREHQVRERQYLKQ
jgi:hypothetical protein